MLPPKALALIPAFFGVVHSISSLNFTSPSQCDPLSLSWSGGTPPFQLLLVPLFQVPANLSLPPSAFDGRSGSYNYTVQFPKGQQLLLVLSDATGPSSSVVSEVLTVGSSVSGNSCNTTGLPLGFPFDLNAALIQCRPYTIDWDPSAVQPVTIYGYIPGGNVVTLHPPKGPTSFDWTADLAAGTSIVFAMTDAVGKSGGSSDMKLSGASDDKTCLVNNFPSSTVSSTSATSPILVTSSSTSSSKSSSNGLVIGLATTASFLALTAIVLVSIVCVRRRSRGSGLLYDEGKRKSQHVRPVDFLDRQDTQDAEPEILHRVTPFAYSATPAARSELLPPPSPSHSSPQTYSSTHVSSLVFSNLHVSNPQYDDSGLSLPMQVPHGERSKAQQAGIRDFSRPQRFIVHTDVEDVEAADQAVEVVELPPQYSERHGLQSHTSASYYSRPSASDSS